eukprot:CAMPEP_0175073036 /NCGR_PEP_ID=MMETSP0052_2-20121109/20294_1 /TAXON_ID=51329 ORGANISM="Polytomella parva, Strain SAG 63-3" /NCGR_SAMPLE_ID=MMETSP0052_2 /ASSEMBLY_ACC=CAM_ASM_000194 /LENGTH=492 /DNA_ID=CAMNT_0016340711 /DNA_START=21 /DNA_END=1499 /DNA_ORIENTATION=+
MQSFLRLRASSLLSASGVVTSEVAALSNILIKNNKFSHNISTSSNSILLQKDDRRDNSKVYISNNFSQVRNMAIFNSGVPGPRPEVAQKLSTEYQGHIIRMIGLAGSPTELDEVLFSAKKHLRPVHISRACMKLELLRGKEKGRVVSEGIKTISRELENYIELFSTKFTIGQVSQIVRGLSSVNHTIPSELLLKLAAVVIADDGRQVQLANEMDCRDLFFGFFLQGFDNELFWKRLCESVHPRLPYFNADVLATCLRVCSGFEFLKNTDFSEAVLRALLPKVGDLSPARLADASTSANMVDSVDASGLNAKIEERFLRGFVSFPPKDAVTIFNTLANRKRINAEIAAKVAPIIAAHHYELPLRHIRRAVDGLVASSWVDTAEVPVLAILAKQTGRLVLGRHNVSASAILGKHVDAVGGNARIPIPVLVSLARSFANTGLMAGPGPNQPLAPFFAALQRDLETRISELDDAAIDDFADLFRRVGIEDGARVVL